MESLATAKDIKDVYATELLRKRNVVGVGLGHRFTEGRNTGELGIVVSVARKVPASALAPQDLVPSALGGIKTDVVQTGVLRAFETPSPRDRWRPVIPPGVSIGHSTITAGTFGCLVERDGERFILSNNHVLAAVNEGEDGDTILQPGPADGGTIYDRVATLADYVPLDFGSAPSECQFADLLERLLNCIAGTVRSRHQVKAVQQTSGVNQVDAALARPVSTDLVTNEILYIGAPTAVGAGTLGTRVQKTGRTSGHTEGFIVQVDATVRINYRGPTALFTGQLVASPMSQPGDSGSAVLDMDKRVVGLLFAGSEAATIMNPIDEVLTALDVTLAL